MALAPQRSILGPTDLPTGLAVRYGPASASLEVGGDWYGVVELPEGRRAVVGEVGRGSRLHHGVLRHHRPPQQHSASQQRRALPALLAEPDGTVRQLNHAMSPPLAVAADRDRAEAT